MYHPWEEAGSSRRNIPTWPEEELVRMLRFDQVIDPGDDRKRSGWTLKRAASLVRPAEGGATRRMPATWQLSPVEASSMVSCDAFQGCPFGYKRDPG